MSREERRALARERRSRRRRALAVGIGVVALAGVAAVAFGVAGGGDEASSGRPNIILITTDDQTLESMSEQTMPRTLELLGEEGTEFTEAIVTTPLCCPSRATMITGQYSHNHRVLLNNPGYPALESKRNVLPAWMQRAGYTTAHIGKYLNGYERWVDDPAEPAPGWDETRRLVKPQLYYGFELSVNGELRGYGENHLTDVLTNEAVEIIDDEAGGEDPLYMQLEYLAPHFQDEDTGGRCENYAIPAPGDEEAFVDAELPRNPSFDEEDVSDKPSAISTLPRISDDREDAIKRRYRCALASLRGVDRGIARVVEALEDAGELERSLVVFVSDNGFFYGEHRIGGQKGLLYDEATRVPLLMRLGSELRDGAERVRRVREPVANIDLPATFLELAGGEPCRSPSVCRVMDGRSLLGLLRGHDPDWPKRRNLLVEVSQRSNAPGDRSLCTYIGVRTPRRAYFEHVRAPHPETDSCVPSGEVEHYDLEADPNQLENLTRTAPGSRAERRLERILTRLRNCSGIRGRDPEPANGSYCD